MTIARTTILVLAATAMPAMAQTAAPTAAAAKPERKICRNIDVTGSIMNGTRVCHTKAEWASIDQRNGDNVASSRDIRGGGGSARGN